MNRPLESGSEIVTGAASRSKTPAEYSVSRFERTTSCWSIGVGSRMWMNLPNPPSLTTLPKYKSLSALAKLSADTGTAPSGVVRALTIRTIRRRLPLRVELDGQTLRAAQAHHRLPRHRSGGARVQQPARDHVQRFGDLAPGQVGAQAVVDAAAKRQYGRRPLANDVDAVRVVVHRGITVGRSGIHQDHRAGGEEVAVEVGVLDDQAKGSACDRRVAHG